MNKDFKVNFGTPNFLKYNLIPMKKFYSTTIYFNCVLYNVYNILITCNSCNLLTAYCINRKKIQKNDVKTTCFENNVHTIFFKNSSLKRNLELLLNSLLVVLYFMLEVGIDHCCSDDWDSVHSFLD